MDFQNVQSAKNGSCNEIGQQAKRIYDLLQIGPVKTSDLALVSLQYNARLHELRHALAKIGLMIDQQDGQGGENEYTIVELDRSLFWQRVKEKGEEWKWMDVGSAPIEPY